MRVERTHEYRRYQNLRRKNRIRWYYRDVIFDYEHRHDEHRWWSWRGMDIEYNWLENYIGKTASHNHSCIGCGNPRYHWGCQIVTKQEYMSEVDFCEQLIDLDLGYSPPKSHFTKYYG